MPLGVIIKGISGFYYIRSDNVVYECKAKGSFRKDDIVPLPGDRCRFTIIDEPKKNGFIDEILERKTQLVRPAVANVDQIAAVIAAKSPLPDLMLLDKLLLTSLYKGINTVICINKIDLDSEAEYRQITESYEKAGFNVIPISTKYDIGLTRLKAVLKDHTTVFAGQSGVGKSTILNKVMNTWALKTGDISEKIERGKHTTRHAELLELDFGGFVADTPGFSSFELIDISHDELEEYYPEFIEYINKCRFTGCSHIKEPECAVKAAIKEGKICKDRYERYVGIYNMLKENKSYRQKGHVHK